MQPDPPVEGKRMLLLCVGSNTVRVTILGWTKDDQQLLTDSRIRNSDGAILIDPLRLSDSGCYRCYGRHAGEHLNTTIKVQVAGETIGTYVYCIVKLLIHCVPRISSAKAAEKLRESHSVANGTGYFQLFR